MTPAASDDRRRSPWAPELPVKLDAEENLLVGHGRYEGTVSTADKRLSTACSHLST